LGFLILSATWVVWRNEFTLRAMGLSILAFFGGMMFLPIYLLCLLKTAPGGIAPVLLGTARFAKLQQG
jgi:hypothetical protein